MNNEQIRQEMIQSLRKLPPETLRQKADEFAKKQELQRYDDIIEHMSAKNNGDPVQFYDNWKPLMWQANDNKSRQTVTVNGKEILSCDMDYYIAESLQSLQASQDPEAEYYSWVDQAKTVLRDMKTDGTTIEELHARHDFIAFLDDRETELKRVIALYSGAAFNSNCQQSAQAREKLKFLTFKLSELRRLRERVQNTKPTRPNSNQAQKEAYRPVMHVAITNYGDYNRQLDDDVDDLDVSAAAVGTAAHLATLHIMRQSTIQNVHVDKVINNEGYVSNQPENMLEKAFMLSGRLPTISAQQRQGFKVSNYNQLMLNRSNTYEADY